VILGYNPPEIAYWERGEWWLAGDAKPRQPEAVTVSRDPQVVGGYHATAGADRAQLGLVEPATGTR
jgi:hypothetical protein